jgi:hypothetical protein
MIMRFPCVMDFENAAASGSKMVLRSARLPDFGFQAAKAYLLLIPSASRHAGACCLSHFQHCGDRIAVCQRRGLGPESQIRRPLNWLR